MSRLTRDGTAESVSRDQLFRRKRGQGNIHFPCSADHEQDWQPYPVDPYSCYVCDHTHTHTYTYILSTCLLHTNSGRGKREAHNSWSMVKPEKTAPVTGTTLRTTGPVPADSRITWLIHTLLHVMTIHTYFQHAYFIPIVGGEKERRIAIGPW